MTDTFLKPVWQNPTGKGSEAIEASTTIAGMSIFRQFSLQSKPVSTTSETVEAKPYATTPKSVLTTKDYSFAKPVTPGFCNVISLKTMENNLLLQFGFVQNRTLESECAQASANSAVVLSSDTAKQLFCALAELFECEILPKP